MAKFKDPTYECDFCGTQSHDEYPYEFVAEWIRNHWFVIYLPIGIVWLTAAYCLIKED